MSYRIEFGKFVASESSKKYVMDCLEKGWVSIGEKTKEFEQKFAALFNYKYCKSVSSGTSAGIASCMTLYDLKNAKQGDEVICPALTFIATANAIRAAGFTPKFVDVDWDMNINVDLVEAAITEKTRAIKAVGLMGKPPKLDKLQEIAKKYNLLLIVDGCESYGNKYKGHHALHYADIETSSHYVGHLLVGAEGGTCLTNSEEIEQIVKSVRSHGRVGDSLYFDHVRYGLNLKPSDIHSALLLGTVDDFWKIFNKRRENYKFVRKAVEGLEDVAWFTEEDPEDINCPHGFSITLKPKYKDKIQKFNEFLQEKSIHAKRNFGEITSHGCFSYMNESGKYPVAKYVGDYGLHVGVHYFLSQEDLEYLASSLKEFLIKISS